MERKPCYELWESRVIPRFGETRFPSRPREAMMRGESSNRPNYALGINCWRITFTNPIHPVIKLACRNAARVRWSANASRTPVHVANFFPFVFSPSSPQVSRNRRCRFAISRPSSFLFINVNGRVNETRVTALIDFNVPTDFEPFDSTCYSDLFQIPSKYLPNTLIRICSSAGNLFIG